MSTPPRIEVHDSAPSLATAVAGELLTRLADVQASGSEPQVALTGGGIAEAVHAEIARLSAASEVDWSRVVVWWGDERFVAPDSEERNALGAVRVLSAVGLDPDKVHQMPSTADAPDVAAGAEAYAATFEAHAADELDVVMLGVGPDGHVASLFPGYPQLDADADVVPVTDSPKPPPERISLTFGALSRARSVWFLVSGDGKAEAVARALAEGTDRHDCPAAGVRGSEETIWFLDREAASRL